MSANQGKVSRSTASTDFGLNALESRVMMSGDVILEWNTVTTDALTHDTHRGPLFPTRELAIVHVAMYDAFNGVEHKDGEFMVNMNAKPGCSMEAAVAGAAYETLVSLFPTQKADFDAALAKTLARIPNGSSETNGLKFGKKVGDRILALRANDGADRPEVYTELGGPGHFRAELPLINAPALGPQWGTVTPWVMDSGDQFLSVPPPALGSAAYTKAYNDVKKLGSVDSTARTADQTEIGVFWGYDVGLLGTPPRLYNQNAQVIAKQMGNTVAENARLFAMINVAMADAGIQCWETKYTYNFWRPISAVHDGDIDGNANTVGDADWQPLGDRGTKAGVANFTPPFPDYTSGHATFGGTVFRTLANFYGTDKVNFKLTSEELPGVTRTFHSFSQAAEENGRSRIYLGIHFEFANQNGQLAGRQIADHLFKNAFQPQNGAGPQRFQAVCPPGLFGRSVVKTNGYTAGNKNEDVF